MHFDSVYCSDLNRCQQTLEHITPYHSYVSAVLDERLREKGAGELEGQPLGITSSLAKKAGVPVREFKAPGGESWVDVHNRAEAFLESVLATHGESNHRVLVVTHGGWIMEFLNVIRKLKGSPPVFANNTQNTSLTVIKFKKARTGFFPRVVMNNDVSHLKVNKRRC